MLNCSKQKKIHQIHQIQNGLKTHTGMSTRSAQEELARSLQQENENVHTKDSVILLDQLRPTYGTIAFSNFSYTKKLFFSDVISRLNFTFSNNLESVTDFSKLFLSICTIIKKFGLIISLSANLVT